MKDTGFDKKLINISNNITSNKRKHLNTGNKLNDLSGQIKIMSTK